MSKKLKIKDIPSIDRPREKINLPNFKNKRKIKL